MRNSTIKNLLSLTPLLTIPVMILALLSGHIGFVVSMLFALSIFAIALGIKLIRNNAIDENHSTSKHIVKPTFTLIKQCGEA